MSAPAPSTSPPGGAGPLEAVGEATRLLGRALWKGRRVRPPVRGILRQAALVTTGSVLALVAVSLLGGTGCAIEATAVSRQLAARGSAPTLSAMCNLREIVPYLFGYVFALGVGSELVIELGARREEDAAERAGPRVLGALFVFPFAYLVALACSQTGVFLTGVGRFPDIPTGNFLGTYFYDIDATDLTYSAAKGLTSVIFVLGAALYLGARAGPDPATITQATARFALVATVGVSVLCAVATLVFWGAEPRLPIG